MFKTRLALASALATGTVLGGLAFATTALPGAGAATPGAATTPVADDNGQAGDVRGRCGEAEHANDPRCTAAGEDRAEDRPPAADDNGRNRGPNAHGRNRGAHD